MILRKVVNWWFKRKVEVYLGTIGVPILIFSLVSITVGFSDLFATLCFFTSGIGMGSLLQAGWRSRI